MRFLTSKMGVLLVPASPDNAAIREMRDILKESQKQSKYMLWLTVMTMVLTAVQIALLLKS